MFKALDPQIDALAMKYPRQITELEGIFDRKTNLYFDYANLRNWSSRLKWSIDMAKLYKLLRSFDTVNEMKVYYGTIPGDGTSEKRIQSLRDFGYNVVTKSVKFIKLSIDVSGLASDSATNVIKNFVAPELLRKLKVESIEYLNRQLRDLNKQGVTHVQKMKCNFDVEIGRDMQLDHLINMIPGFSLWSGDSDFADPIAEVLRDGKKATLFATARKVATELNGLKSEGLFIYEISKIKEFVS
jgi:uncharacterized LabA/DUF88 family protein